MANDKGKKGFAGLNSMVSDVEVPKPRPAPAPEPVRQQEAPRPSAEPKPAYSPPKPSGGGAGKWWAIGIGVVVLFSWLGGSDKNSSARSAPTPSYSAPSYSTPAPVPAAAPAYTPPVYVPEPAPVYATNDEEMPPVGSGLSLSRSQIRYCLSEKIRVTAWQGQVNEYSEASVDAFNEAVRDYNSRCSNFRYRSGALEGVRSEVEANRYALQLQGMASATMNP
jgi:hypothetical protein